MSGCFLRRVFPTVFGPFSLFGATALIGDGELERISRCAPLPSIEQLRRYLVKWPRVDSLLESMWKALSDNGFTVTQSPPEAIQPPTPSQSAPSASTSRKTRRAPKSRRQNKGLRESQGDASSANVILQPPLPAPSTPSSNWGSFVREWMPDRERNYEINHNTSLDDFRRLFAAQAAARLQAESDTKHPRSPSPPASSSKRQRLDNTTPGQAPAHTTPSLPLAVSGARQLQPNSPHEHLVPQEQARPVARLIVRSQRVPANSTPASLHPSHTTRRVELRHPQPRRLPLPSQTIRTHARSLINLGPERPPRPPPSTELSLAAYSSIHILIAQDLQSSTEARR